jgi:GT2 family glycosyltransferase
VAIEVLIPTVDGGERLAEALESLRAQTLRPAVCVLHNGSDPQTRRVVAGFSEVRSLWFERNLGFGAALNRGVATSRARLVVFLNDDVIADGRMIERIASAQQASGAEMVAACLVTPDGLVDSAGVGVDRSLIAYDLFHGEPYGSDGHRDAAPMAPTGGAAGFERRAFERVGGFDESFFAYLEDVELGLRMRGAGMRCVGAYDAFGWHRHSATLGRGSASKNELMGRSRGYLLSKYRDQLGLVDRVRGGLIDAITYAGQVAIDRNAGALRGRRQAHHPPASERWPAADLARVPRVRAGVRRALAIRLSRRRAR